MYNSNNSHHGDSGETPNNSHHGDATKAVDFQNLSYSAIPRQREFGEAENAIAPMDIGPALLSPFPRTHCSWFFDDGVYPHEAYENDTSLQHMDSAPDPYRGFEDSEYVTSTNNHPMHLSTDTAPAQYLEGTMPTQAPGTKIIRYHGQSGGSAPALGFVLTPPETPLDFTTNPRSTSTTYPTTTSTPGSLGAPSPGLTPSYNPETPESIPEIRYVQLSISIRIEY